MAGRLAGKTAIVTSAAQGIGRASALAMAREGAKVFATDIREDLLASLADESKTIEMLKLDVLKQAEIDWVAKRVGTPDILFNCSGFVHAGTLMETDDKAWDFSFDLNVKAHFHMIKAFMPAWLDRGNGVIVNMASAASSIRQTSCLVQASRIGARSAGMPRMWATSTAAGIFEPARARRTCA